MSNAFSRLLHDQSLVFFHPITTFGALPLGAAILWRHKGSRSHRALGWGWGALTGSTALACAFIRHLPLPDVARITPAHTFTALVAGQLPRGLWLIRRRNVAGHRLTLRGLVTGACVPACMFTLLPGRFIGTSLWKHALGVVA